MGLDFSKVEDSVKKSMLENEVNDSLTKADETYNVLEDKKAYEKQMADSKEIEAIISSIDLSDASSLAIFGRDVAMEISKCCDSVLNSKTQLDADDTTANLLEALSNVMRRIDPKEITKEPGFFNKIFDTTREAIDKILDKFTSIGDEIEKINSELKVQEESINKDNVILKELFEKNKDLYHKLIQYIMAGEKASKELEDHIAELKLKAKDENADKSIALTIQALEQSLITLEQRVDDMRKAENIALQSIPLINNMQFTNINLIRKINSTFIITLPAFKQGLVTAVQLKRQEIQAKALSKIDEETNRMLEDNAALHKEVAPAAARLAAKSSIDMETLEKTWSSIISTVDEITKIQEDARTQRETDAKRLEEIKKEFFEKFQDK